MNKKEQRRMGFNYGFYTGLVTTALLMLLTYANDESQALRIALFVIWFLLAFIINIGARVFLYTKE